LEKKMNVVLSVEPDIQPYYRHLERLVLQAGYEVVTGTWELERPFNMWPNDNLLPMDTLLLKVRAETVPNGLQIQPNGIRDDWPFGATIFRPGVWESRPREFQSPDFPPSEFEALARWITRTLLDLVPEIAFSARIELFASTISRRLDEEKSELRSSLQKARISSVFLKGQLRALLEATASGQKRIVRAVLGVIGEVLLSLSTGAVEGASSATTPHVAGQGLLRQLVVECQDLRHQIIGGSDSSN
jgi:hypothetical protein